MINFKIGTQIEKEIEEFRTAKIRLASYQQNDESVRFAKPKTEGYYFNQHDTISLIDLYYNSRFESGEKDKNNQRKVFMNVGKFRTDVSAKQIDLDVKDGKFIPDDYADPWPAIFMQKDFKEWAKAKRFGEEINSYKENFPRYGTVVGKKVGDDIKQVPLQNLINEQTAENLQVATYVIEEHPNMSAWEIDQMTNWNSDGLQMKYTDRMDVHERYGYVPLKWLKEANGEQAGEGDESKFVDAQVIAGKVNNSKEATWHVFSATQITKRPYEEAHWNKQHGRWLGLGVMEDQFENQKAKNIIVNLIRRSLQWSSKKIFQSRDSNVTAKNLVREIPDGAIIEIGAEGQISEVITATRNNAEFQQFLNEWEKNSDQKAFTYEVATGEQTNSTMTATVGVLLSKAVNSFFDGKREKLGLFLENAVNTFLVPQFLKDMANKDRVVMMFGDEVGFEILKDAAMHYVRSEASRITLMSGKPVDAQAIESVVQPFQEVASLPFNLKKTYYQDVKSKFTFSFVGESEDVQAKAEMLKNLFELLSQRGDPRAEKVLERYTALGGESMAQFGSPQAMGQNQISAPAPAPSTSQRIPATVGK